MTSWNERPVIWLPLFSREGTVYLIIVGKKAL